MKYWLEEIKALYRAQKHKEALSFIESLEEEACQCPDIFVWKGRCLQLIDEDPSYDLSDIEKVYRQALEIDAEHIAATVDLAFFYLNVLDDADRAIKLFKTAFDLSKDQITEVVVGMASCLAELESKDAALSYIANIKEETLDRNGIQKLVEELEAIG